MCNTQKHNKNFSIIGWGLTDTGVVIDTCNAYDICDSSVIAVPYKMIDTSAIIDTIASDTYDNLLPYTIDTNAIIDTSDHDIYNTCESSSRREDSCTAAADTYDTKDMSATTDTDDTYIPYTRYIWR